MAQSDQLGEQSGAQASIAADFAQQVNGALKNYHSILALARSTLANSALVKPLLILDDLSPTPEERGAALRLVLQWAVNRLAPTSPPYPLGTQRPYDDPTWRDPRWWRYNILRHRYLEPLHPDDFVEGGRFTETLLALTGIPSADTLFDERNRAIAEVGQWLRRQTTDGLATAELQQLALQAVYHPLTEQPTAHNLLTIAATFDGVFPRALLLQMAATEQFKTPESALDFLITHRYLSAADAQATLSMAPLLGQFLYRRQPKALMRLRHQRAAEFYRQEHDYIQAIQHLQAAGQWPTAGHLILTIADKLVNDFHVDELHQLLVAFHANHVDSALWRELQILRCDLYYKSGQHDNALAACRAALKVTEEPSHQARLYRRMGKLYEKRNPRHALGYYNHAAECFTVGDNEYPVLLKDRGWVHILLQAWENAEQDLTLGLSLTEQTQLAVRADIYDALASLYRYQRQYKVAIDQAQHALMLREELGDLLSVAKSFGNLGRLYNDTDDYELAIDAYTDAMVTYKKLGNIELMVVALLNIGVAQHLLGHLATAIETYRRSLALCQQIGLTLEECKLHSNLAEALAELNEITDAQTHWGVGYRLALAENLVEEVAYFQELAQRLPCLQTSAFAATVTPTTTTEERLPNAEEASSASLLKIPDAQLVLDLVKRELQITPKLLIETLHMSKATATRRLTELVEQGYLTQQGKGRGTYYILTQANGNRQKSPLLTNPAKQTEVNNAMPTPTTLAQTLQQHQSSLYGEYALTALGLIPINDINGSVTNRIDLVARFATLPDLARFFALEGHLAQLLRLRIDLKLADTAQAQSVMWLWQTENNATENQQPL